jgi:uncharacterized protein (DUF1330 family)
MAAYMLFIREGAIVDHAAMAAYQAANQGGAAPGLKPLAVYGAIEAIEGEAADGVVLLEFPDTAAARDWYFGDYQERAKLRQKAAPYRCMLIEGL